MDARNVLNVRAALKAWGDVGEDGRTSVIRVGKVGVYRDYVSGFARLESSDMTRDSDDVDIITAIGRLIAFIRL